MVLTEIRSSLWVLNSAAPYSAALHHCVLFLEAPLLKVLVSSAKSYPSPDIAGEMRNANFQKAFLFVR